MQEFEVEYSKTYAQVILNFFWVVYMQCTNHPLNHPVFTVIQSLYMMPIMFKAPSDSYVSHLLCL